MRIYIIALITAISISGCKTDQDFAGSGPLILSPSVKKFLDGQLWKLEAVTAVAYNGNYAYAFACPQGLGCQSDSFNPEIVIGNCEKEAPRCALYSSGGFVLWKGPVSVSGSGKTMSAKQACTMAIVIENGVVSWEDRNKYAKYVAQAKSNGMTPHECAVLTDQVAGLKSQQTTQPLIKPDSSISELQNTGAETKGDSRPIAMNWEGYSKLIAGTVTLNQNKKSDSVAMTLPNGDGTCTGNYTMQNNTAGVWSLACSNGMAASGTLTAYGQGKGSSGEGVDTKGKKVTYTLGGV